MWKIELKELKSNQNLKADIFEEQAQLAVTQVLPKKAPEVQSIIGQSFTRYAHLPLTARSLLIFLSFVSIVSAYYYSMIIYLMLFYHTLDAHSTSFARASIAEE